MIPINKRNIATSFLLSIVTFGIYLIYWEYLLVKNTRTIKRDESSCTGEMLCLIFVPFYSLYWWFTRGKTVKDEFANRGYSATGNEIAYLVLGIFGLSIVSMAIMQNDFNSLPSESTKSNSLPSESTKSNQRSALKKFRLFFYLSIGGFLLAAAAVAVIPLLQVGVKGLDATGYTVGALFWAGILCGIVFLILTGEQRKQIETVLREKGGQTPEKAPLGVISFFRNRAALIVDIIFFLAVIAFVLLFVFQIHNAWAVIAALEILFLSFVMHCFLNGINYKYIKAYNKYIKSKEQGKK